MQVRVFEAENMQSALRQVKKELGPKAIIISTRTVRKGKTGVFQKPKLEVTAALEAETGSGSSEEAAQSGAPASQPKSSWPQATYSRPQPNPYAENGTGQTFSSAQRQEKGRGSGQDYAGQGGSLESIQGEIAEIRQMVKDLRATEVMGGRSSSLCGAEDSQGERQDQDAVLQTLMSRGIEWEAACKVAARFRERFGQQYSPGESPSLEGINSVLAALTRVRDPLWGEQGSGKKRMALLGPTGVGKTTTVAKLAANYLSRISPKIALITVDNYRIAAVEQLKIYAQIMNIPLEVVTAPEQISTTLARHEDKDLVLLDTAGRSPQDEVSLRELSSFLAPGTGLENHLLLSASTREQDMQRSIHSFQRFGLSGLIFTKMDECEDYGALFNIHFRNEFPLSYFTTGQKVPEDLMAANGSYIAEGIINQTRESSHE